MSQARGHEPWCLTQTNRKGYGFHNRLVCQCRADIACADWLVEFLRLIVPIAAALQMGRCRCGRIIPWERIDWAYPHCYSCEPEDEMDRQRAARLRAIVRGDA